MIPQSFIQDLLARVDIVEVIERYLPLKKGGANYFACCPFHGEKSPSFSVSPSKQFYHCFGCGAHGSAIGFLMAYSGLSYVEAIEELARQVGVTVPDDGQRRQPDRSSQHAPLLSPLAEAARFYREQLKRSPAAIDYLKSRGLSGEISARYGIGYAPPGWQSLQAVFPDYHSAALLEAGLVIENEQGRRYDRFRDRIMFPIQDARGNIIGFGGRVLGDGEPKYLNSPETPLFEKGRELYGLAQARNSIRERGEVLVVEGYMDVVALAQFGIGHAVATLGTATTATHIQKLLRMASRVVFCFDGDAAGHKAAARALDVALEHLNDERSIAFLFLPDRHDPDSFVREQGAEAFLAACATARPLAELLLEQLMADCDLSTAEGRAKLVASAKNTVMRVAAPLLRLQLIKAIAQASQFDQAEVERAWGLKPSPRQHQPGSFASRTRTGAIQPRRAPVSPAETLLRLTLAHPAWALRIPPDLIVRDSAESAALVALIDACSVGELSDRAGIAVLVEHFRDTPHGPTIARIAAQLDESSFQPEEAETLLNDTLNKLASDSLSREIDQLIARQRSTGLNHEERRLLSELLSERTRLKTPRKSA